jgi:hypothetical protein
MPGLSFTSFMKAIRTLQMEDGPGALRDRVVNGLWTEACDQCIRVPYTLHLMPTGGTE